MNSSSDATSNQSSENEPPKNQTDDDSISRAQNLQLVCWLYESEGSRTRLDYYFDETYLVREWGSKTNPSRVLGVKWKNCPGPGNFTH
eukprot:m.257394 g.257394  ORF g.257394 m.257394 type:complete len:88 (+) comp26753_c0_seq5:833-1096(+)